LDGWLSVKGLRVCELGAGAAFPSLACSRVGARFVVATDYPSEPLISNIDKNIRTNSCSDIAAMGHLWGDPISELEQKSGGAFDLIIMADTLWRAEGHADLIQSLDRLSNAKARVVVAYMDHDVDGRVSKSFFAQCLSVFEIVEEKQVDWSEGQSDYYGDVFIRVLRRKTPSQ